MNEALLNALKRPFDPNKIHWRVGVTNDAKDSGIPFAYIDSRDCQQRLDEVCPMQWQSRYSHAGKVFICEVGIKVDDEWHWRANGAGETQFEAEKGGMSDAFKRACSMWGVGRYLYKLNIGWVPIVKAGGGNYKPRAVPDLPRWAYPEEYDLMLAGKPGGVTDMDILKFRELVEGDQPLDLFEFMEGQGEGALSVLLESFQHGKKTELKRRYADQYEAGRQAMVGLIPDLKEFIDNEDTGGIYDNLWSFSNPLQKRIINNLDHEYQDKLNIISEAA